MAGTDLARIDSFPIDIIAPAADLAQRIAKTEFVPTALRNRPEAVLACMLAGNEVGIGPMQALSKIHIIEGRPAMAAELMRALVQREGHEIWFQDTTNTKVTICGRRRESEHVTPVTWTLDDAKRAGLEAKQNWRKYPRQMLVARATGDLCRMVFADVLGGISYTPEELEDGILDAAPADDDGTAEPAKPITRKAAPAKKAAAPRAAAPAAGPVAQPPLPPLPGEDDFEDPTAPATDDDAVKLAQKVAIRCQEAGLDDEGRHNLIRAVTNGVKASGKDLTGEEAAEVLDAARGIQEGRTNLVQDDDGRWQLIAVEDATGAEQDDPQEEDDDAFEGAGDESGWTSEKWRRYLSARGVKTSALIRKAQELANDIGVKPPGNLEGIVGESQLCALLRGFVEEMYEERTGA